jgi:hypothetical protein
LVSAGTDRTAPGGWIGLGAALESGLELPPKPMDQRPAVVVK